MPLRGSLSISLVAHEFVDGVRFVMHAKAVNDGGAGFIQTQHLDLGAFTTELDNHLVQGCNGSDVPEMRLGQIDGDFPECFLEVDDIGEFVRRAEENLTHNQVGAVRVLRFKTASDVTGMSYFVGKKK